MKTFIYEVSQDADGQSWHVIDVPITLTSRKDALALAEIMAGAFAMSAERDWQRIRIEQLAEHGAVNEAIEKGRKNHAAYLDKDHKEFLDRLIGKDDESKHDFWQWWEAFRSASPPVIENMQDAVKLILAPVVTQGHPTVRDGDGVSMVAQVMVTQGAALRAAQARVTELEGVLYKIAAYDEGPVVNEYFDCPHHAKEARAVLERKP